MSKNVRIIKKNLEEILAGDLNGVVVTSGKPNEILQRPK